MSAKNRTIILLVVLSICLSTVSYAANSFNAKYSAVDIFDWRWTRTDSAIGVYADPELYNYLGSWEPGTKIWVERRLENVTTSVGDTVSIAETGGAFGEKFAYVRAAELIITPQAQKPNHLSIAIGEIGNSYSKYNKWYGSLNGSYEYAWCASFVSWVLSAAGYPNATKTVSCQDMWDYYNKRGMIKTKSSDYTPKPGDLVFYDWDGGVKYDHVDIVEYVDGGGIHTVSGNSGKGTTTTRQVTRVTRSDLGSVIGYALTGR